LINPTFHLEIETQVTDLVLSLVIPTLHLKSAKVVALFTSLVNPTLRLMSDKVIDLVPSSVSVALHMKSVTVVDLVPPSVDPTSPMKTPPSNEAILFYWGVLSRPRLPSHIPFKITIQFCGQNVPHALIDDGSSVSILSSISWKDLGYPNLVPITHTLFTFNRRTSHPLGILPRFPITLGGKTIFIDVMVV
jgi:hypothetical protein